MVWQSPAVVVPDMVFVMRQLLVRILKNGTITAVILAVFGYVMGEVAELWLAGQPAYSRGDASPGGAAEVGSALRGALPVRLAALGFGMVVVFECLAWVVRGQPRPAPRSVGQTPRPAAGSAEEVDQLYRKLLADSEATGHRRPDVDHQDPPADEDRG